MTLAAYISDSMTLLIFVVFFIPAFSVAENNTCPLYFSGYDGSCMVGSEFQDGDVIFGIMANIHKTTDSRPWCGSLSTPDFELVAMVRWLLRKLELGGYVKGVKFGKIIQNDDILGISNIKGGIWDMVSVSLLLLLLSLLLVVVWWRLWWWWWQGGGGRGGGVAWGLMVVVVVVVGVGWGGGGGGGGGCCAEEDFQSVLILLFYPPGYRVHDSCHREELVPRGLLALVPQLETENCMASRVVGKCFKFGGNPLQAQSLATVFIIMFVFPSPRPFLV